MDYGTRRTSDQRSPSSGSLLHLNLTRRDSPAGRGRGRRPAANFKFSHGIQTNTVAAVDCLNCSIRVFLKLAGEAPDSRNLKARARAAFATLQVSRDSSITPAPACPFKRLRVVRQQSSVPEPESSSAASRSAARVRSRRVTVAQRVEWRMSLLGYYVTVTVQMMDRET